MGNYTSGAVATAGSPGRESDDSMGSDMEGVAHQEIVTETPAVSREGQFGASGLTSPQFPGTDGRLLAGMNVTTGANLRGQSGTITSTTGESAQPSGHREDDSGIGAYSPSIDRGSLHPQHDQDTTIGQQLPVTSSLADVTAFFTPARELFQSFFQNSPDPEEYCTAPRSPPSDPSSGRTMTATNIVHTLFGPAYLLSPPAVTPWTVNTLFDKRPTAVTGTSSEYTPVTSIVRATTDTTVLSSGHCRRPSPSGHRRSPPPLTTLSSGRGQQWSPSSASHRRSPSPGGHRQRSSPSGQATRPHRP